METLFNSALPKLHYRKEKTAFYSELVDNVNQYFKVNQLEKEADNLMIGKTIFLFSAWAAFYFLMLSNRLPSAALLLTQVAFHFTMFVMTVGIAHDGSHHAYSKNMTVNKWISRVFDLVGINSYLWEFNHVRSHHRAPNVPIYDSSIDSFVFFRFHPRASYRRYHRYQHYYIFFIYGCSTLFKLFFLDIFSFRRKRIGFISFNKHPFNQIMWFAFTRAFVIIYTLIIPLLVIHAPALQILGGFLLGHFISGLALGIIFQTTHLTDRTVWPEPDETGLIDNSFDQHILDTTADFASHNKVITWISGGLNLHVAHHLLPNISHTHLPAITEIVKQVAARHQLNYKVYDSISDAVRSHLTAMRRLGMQDYHYEKMTTASKYELQDIISESRNKNLMQT